jgi:hypothetical protein
VLVQWIYQLHKVTTAEKAISADSQKLVICSVHFEIKHEEITAKHIIVTVNMLPWIP